ncbi:hypothetical protein ETAA8_39600 [Anatilimnocola aggregata]|uniref:Uncharacterized protein n=1 Tax=Anatilimnocola aggregata TaxID=2528021 RepID=A0A517YF38_9BACT|nr:hypothetical protein [Anatilimnocola aggregata]QDU28855.1 hypothetical protein ETAA8_39600 [Anatilimnocola aggregata]
MSADSNTPKSASEAAAQREAAAAYKKVLSGESLSNREQTALKKFERDKEEKLRWQYYGKIPQKHWREMSGRQTKVLHEQAGLYGLPFGGANICLPDVVLALHNFLAANARKLAAPDDELMQSGANSPALERYREERATLAKLERQEREGTLLPRDEARDGLGRIATRLRAAGELLERQFGPEAREILDEALSDADREIEQVFGGTDESDPQ